MAKKLPIPANIKSRLAMYKIFRDGLANTPKSNVQKRAALQRGVDIYEKKFTAMGISF